MVSFNKVKRVAIVPRLGKPKISSICNDLLKWLTDHRIEAVMPISDAQALGKEKIGCTEDELMKDADLVVVLGGDGTILRAARLLNGKETPILGVNLGRFGFLAEVEVAHLFIALEKTIAGDLEVEKRMMLNCEIVWGQVKVQKNALNEIFVGRRPVQRLLEFDVKINNKFFNRFSCDGLIFASPTGSTAYALSAGGPLISPKNRLISVVPVCPHSLFNRSLILEEKEKIEIALTERLSKATITIDGIVVWNNEPFDYIKVESSEHTVNLIKFGKCDFYTILREKLKIYSSFSNNESGVQYHCF